MTMVDELQQVLEINYTVEELAVIADLYDLDTLPGIAAVQLSAEARGLATRCLIARGALRMPATGGVEIPQPHATLLSGLLDAPLVHTVSWIEGDDTELTTWFEHLGPQPATVRMRDRDGIVELVLYDASAMTAVESTLGIEVVGDLQPGTLADVVVEVITTTRSTVPVTVERRVAGRVDGRWYAMTD